MRCFKDTVWRELLVFLDVLYNDAESSLSWVAGLFFACLVAGCAFHDGTTTHIIGYARVVETESPTDGVVLKGVQMVGARVGDGIGVGYFNEKRIVVPLDCRLVVIVRNSAQLEEVSRRLAGLQRRELCVAIEP